VIDIHRQRPAKGIVRIIISSKECSFYAKTPHHSINFSLESFMLKNFNKAKTLKHNLYHEQHLLAKKFYIFMNNGKIPS